MFRIRGLVKRLVDLNEKEINLSHCYLVTDSSLSQYKDMRNWKFSGARLADSSFIMNDLENSEFYHTDLVNARFSKVNLANCKFDSATLYNTYFKECIFENTDLSQALVKEKNWFEILEKNNNLGVEILKGKFKIDRNPIVINEVTLYKIIRN